MSERPFMQLYVSDFIGDTLQLSTEQIGAYMLLLMAMWNGGGKLPADDAKLARVVRMSVKKWRAISDDLMGFFDGDDDHIWNNRLTNELQKSERKTDLRAAAGAKGGAAKALKDKETTVAIATPEPQHLPDTITRAASQQQEAGADLVDRLAEAAGIRGNIPPSLAFAGEIIGLMQAGFDLEADILPAIRARPNPKARSWAYFVPQIREAAERRSAAVSTPKPASSAVDWKAWCEAYFGGANWPHGLGPKPDEPGCKAPADIVEQARQVAA